MKYDPCLDDDDYRPRHSDVAFSDSPDVLVVSDGGHARLSPLSNAGWRYLAPMHPRVARKDGQTFVIKRENLQTVLEGMANSGLMTRIGAKQ